MAEPADLQDGGTALEALDVADPREERCLRSVDANGAGDRDLARRARRQRVFDDLSAAQIGQLCVGEAQRRRQHSAHVGLDAGFLRRRAAGEQQTHEHRSPPGHRLNVTAPALARRSRYSATASSASGSNSALTASRISLTVRVPSTKFAIS